MKILENAINKTSFSVIKNNIFSNNFPWYFSNTSYEVSADEKNLDSWSFSHSAFDDDKSYSNITALLEMSFYEILSKINEPIEKLLRIRIGCLTHKNSCVKNIPHVDRHTPHKVGLLYMNTCDGDTALYNKKYDVNSGVSTYQFYKDNQENFQIENLISPEENKIIFFDGLQYHSSSHPTNSFRRIAVNFNYI